MGQKVQYSTAVVEDGKMVIKSTFEPSRCKFFIMVGEHYREDGSCKCDDPTERAMMIREWEYTEEDFLDSN